MFGYYYAPSRSHDFVTSGDVPFVGWGEPRVEIDIAFGDVAELQRRSAEYALGFWKPSEKIIASLLEVRAANCRTHARRREFGVFEWSAGCGMHSPAPAGKSNRSAPTLATPRHDAEGGRRDAPDHGDAAAHQRNVDRVLATLRQKLSSTVKWIDEQKRRARLKHWPLFAFLLRNDRDPRENARQPLEDHRLSDFVGGGDWRKIRLQPLCHVIDIN